MSIHSDPLYVNVKEAFGLKAGAVEAPRDKKSLTVVTTTSMKRPENAYDSIDFDIDFSIFTTSQKGQADQEKPIISGSGTIAPKKSPFWSVQVWKHNNVFTNAVEGEQKGRVGTAVIKFFHVLGALIGDAVRVVLFPISIPAYFKGPNVNVAPTYPWNKKQVSEINTSTTSTNTAGTKVDMPKPETASASSTSSKPASSEPSITVEKEASKASEAAEVRFALAGFGDYLQGGKLKDRLQKDFQAYSKTTDLHANHVEYRNAKLETSPLADLQRHSRNEGKKLATFALISSELPEGTTNILLAVQNVKQVLGQVLGDIRYNTPDQPLVTDAKVAREEAFKIILNSANAVNTPLSLSFMNGVYAEFERDVNNKAGFVDAIQAAHQKIEAAARLGIVADAPSAIKAIDAKIGSNRIIPAIVKELVADLARGVTAAQAIRNAFAKIESSKEMIDPIEAKKIFLKQALPAIVNQLGNDLKNGLVTKTLDEAVQALLKDVDQAIIAAIGGLPLKDDEKAILSKQIKAEILKGISDNQAMAIESAAVRELFASNNYGAAAIIALAKKLAAQGILDAVTQPRFEKNVSDRLDVVKGLRAQNRWKSTLKNVLLESKDAKIMQGEINALYDAQIGEFQTIIAIDGKSLFEQFRKIEQDIANKQIQRAQYIQTPKKGPSLGGSGSEEHSLASWMQYFGDKISEIASHTEDADKRSREMTELMKHPMYTEAYEVYPKKLDELNKSIQKLIDEAPKKRIAKAQEIVDAFKVLDAKWETGFVAYVAKHQKAIDKHPELAKAVKADQEQRAALRKDANMAFRNLALSGKILGLGSKKEEPAAPSGSTPSKLALRRGRAKSISITTTSAKAGGVDINGRDWSAEAPATPKADGVHIADLDEEITAEEFAKLMSGVKPAATETNELTADDFALFTGTKTGTDELTEDEFALFTGKK